MLSRPFEGAPPARTAVDWMAGAVVAWLVEQQPADLARVAAADQDVAGLILRQYRPYWGLGRWLVRPYRDAIRAATTATWEEILTRVLRQCPAQGLVCWQHKAWFFRQLDRARAELVRLLEDPQ